MAFHEAMGGFEASLRVRAHGDMEPRTKEERAGKPNLLEGVYRRAAKVGGITKAIEEFADETNVSVSTYWRWHRKNKQENSQGQCYRSIDATAPHRLISPALVGKSSQQEISHGTGHRQSR